MISGEPSVGYTTSTGLPWSFKSTRLSVAAVGHHRALAEQYLLRRIGRRLHLHHLLLASFSRYGRAEIAREQNVVVRIAPL